MGGKSSPEYQRRYYRANSDKVYERQQLRRYGITLVEYNSMFAEQQGCCAICGKHQANLKQRLNVDHDHETGVVRGLLCYDCNRGIGLLRTADAAMSASIYLARYGDGEQ